MFEWKRTKKINLNDLKNDILNELYSIKEELVLKIETCTSERERTLEDMLINMKAHKIAEYETVIKKLKDENECNRLLIAQQDKKIEELNKNIEVENDISYKHFLENEELKKQIKKLEKELEKRYIVKRIRPTGPTKETKIDMRIKTPKHGNQADKILKEVSKNNLKEVQDE